MNKDIIVGEIRQCLLNKQEYDGVGTLGLVEDALMNTTYQIDPDWETNGWEVDFWATILDSDDNFYARVYGSMYYGYISITYDND